MADKAIGETARTWASADARDRYDNAIQRQRAAGVRIKTLSAELKAARADLYRAMDEADAAMDMDNRVAKGRWRTEPKGRRRG